MKCAITDKDGKVIKRDELTYQHLESEAITEYSILWGMGLIGNAIKQEKGSEEYTIQSALFDEWQAIFKGLTELDKRVALMRNKHSRKRVASVLKGVEANDFKLYIELRNKALDSLETQERVTKSEFTGL